MAAAGGGAAGGLLGGDSVITQLVLWQVFGQIISAAIGPFLTELQSNVNAANPLTPLTPADLADMVIRAIYDEPGAAAIAAKSGLNADDFKKLVLANGEPPGLESVLEWARRGFVPFADQGPGVPSVPEAIRTSRIRNEWTPVIINAEWLPLTIADAVNAWVRGQVDEATALQQLAYNGIQEDKARILYNTTGRPPAPGQLAEFVRRGIIPIDGTGPTVLSFHQGIIEGDLKDKWEPILEHLVLAIPSAFEIRHMQAQGAIDATTAAKLYQENGFAPDLIAALVASGTTTKLAKQKELSVSIIEAMYRDRLIDRPTAIADLEVLAYSEAEADVILTVVDQARVYQSLNAAITNVRTKFLARKIDQPTGEHILTELGVSAEQQTELFAIWDIEQQAQVKTLTAAEYAAAVYYGVQTEEWAMGKLEALGYAPDDAYTVIALRMHGPLPDAPEGYPQPPPATPPTPPTPPGP